MDIDTIEFLGNSNLGGTDHAVTINLRKFSPDTIFKLLFFCEFYNVKLNFHSTKHEVFHHEFFQQVSPNLQFPLGLDKFTEKILNGKISFLCSALVK